MRRDAASISYAEEIRTQVVRELYDRSRLAVATLVALVLLFGWALVRADKADGSIRALLLFLIGVSIARGSMAMIPTARREAIASVRVQLLVFSAGAVVTSTTLAALIMRIWPVLETAHFAILAAAVSGIVSGAVMSLGASPILYVLYMIPPMGAMFSMAVTDRRPPWGADLLAIAMLLYAGMSIVMTIDHARSRRRGIELSLQLSDLVLRDALTQLRNRRFLHEYMVVEEARMARDATDIVRGKKSEHDDALAVYMVDVDHFKSVNDSFGHAAGDDALKQFADVLASSVRRSDVVVRWGGEEFVIIARIRQREHAYVLAENLRHRVEAADFHVPCGSVLRTTCSIGFCALPFVLDKPQQLSWEHALGLADAALYVAKQEGRNRWVGVRAGATPWQDSPRAYIDIRDDLTRACECGTVVLERRTG